MCVHYWVIDSSDKGVCKVCGEEKDFSPPPIKLVKAERWGLKKPFNHHFYRQGVIWLDKSDVQ